MICYTIPASILMMAIGVIGSDTNTNTLRKKNSILSTDEGSAADQQVFPILKGATNQWKGGLEHSVGQGKKGEQRNGSSNGLEDMSNASISGTWAVVESTGSREGSALGIIEFDGSGNLEGALNVNYPNPEEVATAGRSTFTTQIHGHYEVFDNGLGHIDWTYDEVPEEFGDELNFGIHLLTERRQGSTALQVAGNYEQPSPFVPSGLVRFQMTPRPFTGFDLNSLSGVYALVLTGTDMAGIAFGLITFDGEGGLTGFLNGNGPDDASQRNLFETGIVGSYSVEHHGFGSIQWTFVDQDFDFDINFLITEATSPRAEKVNMQFNVPSPLVPGLVTTVLTYQGPA